MASDDFSALIPVMPAPCFSCNGWFELNDMWGCSEQCDNEVRCGPCNSRHTDTHRDDEEFDDGE